MIVPQRVIDYRQILKIDFLNNQMIGNSHIDITINIVQQCLFKHSFLKRIIEALREKGQGINVWYIYWNF